ncbi:MAG TPA: N-acetylmuramoyl-L-alanine amidase [Firmicutes bacterium]|nr:N-acetylmuramoyl-L-alanine amidase [Bacillota bacterium]
MTKPMFNFGRYLFSPSWIRTGPRKRVDGKKWLPIYFTFFVLFFLMSGILYGADQWLPVNNLSQPLPAAQDQTWVPVEVSVKDVPPAQEGRAHQVVAGQENYLLSIEQVTYLGRPAFMLRTANKFTFNSFLLKKPDRLVVDLDGVVPSPEDYGEFNASGIVKAIRIGRQNSEKTRVVFDLSALVGYKLVNSAEEPDRLLVVFNSVLKEVGITSNTTEPRIFIDTTHPIQYKTTLAFNPHRVIIDLWDVTLMGEPLVIPGSGAWISQIRVSQFDPQTIRVVLDVKEPRGCVVTPSRTVDNRLEIKTIQSITDVQWNQEKTPEEILIRSSGEINEEVAFAEDGQKMVIVLRHAVLAEELKGRAKAAQLGMEEAPASTVRIEVPKPGPAKYKKELNADRNELRIIFAEPPPLQGRLIVLDPGHGGVDAGAIGSQGVREKEINLAVSLKLKKKLEAAGAHVIMTREEDKYVSLYERAAIANKAGSIITLSIHCNFHPDSRVNGFEVFYHPDRKDSTALGKAIFEHVMRQVKIKPLAVKTSKDLVLTRETQMATVLIEMGFLSNRQEESLLKNEKFQDKMVEGIFKGVSAYLQSNQEQ